MDIEELVQRVRAGDREAFVLIVRHYQKDVWRIVVAMLRGVEASESVVQQVFVDAYLHLDERRPGSDFGAWLRAIARNRVRQELRAAIREDRRLAAYRELLLGRLRYHERADREDAAYAEALTACRQELPGHAAEVLDLRYADSLSFEEIAARRGTTAGAVQRMLSRLRLLLRDCIERRLAQA